MKIFAAGISTETNTFCPVPTSLEDFSVLRGRDVLAGRVNNSSLDLSATWGQQAQERGYGFVFSLNAWAQPSGITEQSAYESLRDEILRDLQAAMPVDVVLLMLHGAMQARGYDGCEEDIIRRARSIVGPHAVIGVELDLHCHLSQSMIALADVVITFKEYPHVDVNDRARELFGLAVATRRGEIQPRMALFDCRMVGMYPTSRQPLRAFVDSLVKLEGRDKVLSVSFGHGFQFADVAQVGAKLLVITDGDQLLAERVARELGRQVYAMRHAIGFESFSLPMETALAEALSNTETPVVVADQSDNTGGGAPGDATFVLRWLLEREVREAALAIFYDPVVVGIAKKAGIGARISVRLGGKMGRWSGDPVDMEVAVHAIRNSYMHAFPQESGKPWLFPAGDVVALRCGSIDIVVSSERCQCFCPSIFTDLGIDPTQKRLLIAKSYQHFLSAFAPIAARVIYMAAPGAVPPDPRQIAYRHLDTSLLYPWVEDPLAKLE